MAMAESDVPRRRRRRAVGPAGAPPAGEELQPGLSELAERDHDEDDVERFLRDVPPHHGPV